LNFIHKKVQTLSKNVARKTFLAHLAKGDSCFRLADLNNYSLLKLLDQMYRNLEGSIYRKFSVAIAFVVLIRKQPWPPQAIFFSDWPIFKNLLL
jgi:hypothetical protein